MRDVKPPNSKKHPPAISPFPCAALRQATRAVTRVYDTELRGTGPKTTQHSLLRLLAQWGEIHQGDLGAMAAIDETTLTEQLFVVLPEVTRSAIEATSEI